MGENVVSYYYKPVKSDKRVVPRLITLKKSPHLRQNAAKYCPTISVKKGY
jgi:hypothetical protein